MNREVKFRAWLKNEKKMVKVSELRDIDTDIRSDQNVIYFDFEKQEYCNKGFDEVELMQYTGLKDKNGVKIFEGDIVQWCGNKMEIFWGEDIGCGYGFCWRNIKGDSYYHESMTGFIDEYEVIGNIYENKELLENVD